MIYHKLNVYSIDVRRMNVFRVFPHLFVLIWNDMCKVKFEVAKQNNYINIITL